MDLTDDFPKILHNRCIGCGSCVTVCGPEAVVYYDSKEATKKILQSGEKVAAIVGPSVSGEFSDITDYRKFVEMIRALGFHYVNEASFGVDLVAQKYADLFSNNKGKYYFTANCPALVFYLEKYYPELIPNLAPIVTPMIASAKVIHQKYGIDTKTVYIGPCIANKKEALRYKDDARIDAVITFRELRDLFKEYGITEEKHEFGEFDLPHGKKGCLYPISSGFLQAANISEDLFTGVVYTAEGRSTMVKAVKEFSDHPLVINRHFNVFYDHGCLMGPGTSRGGDRFLRRTLVINYANKRLKGFHKREWEKEMKHYLQLDLSTSFIADDQRIGHPAREKIREVMNEMGKDEFSDNQGCGACGYNSCYEFATNVVKGLTTTEMCITHAVRSRQNSIQRLQQINDQLEQTKDALRESEIAARREQQLARQAFVTMETMLQKLPSSLVIVDEKLHILHTNQSFIKFLGPDAAEINEVIPGLTGADIKTLLPFPIHNLFSFVLQNGEDIQKRDIHYNEQLYNISVFSIRKNAIVGAVIADIHSPEIKKEEVLSRIDEVVGKNLEMVQKIGFLLGETAADTEQMLNTISDMIKGNESHKRKTHR
jgi:Na+-translocating ferredoxin:NAD+ oxidoreductase RNF subunit RnfB